jgi:hypothetical protein
MLSFVISTIVFFVASYVIKRYVDDLGIPSGLTRSTVIFLGALVIAYGVAAVIGWAVS